MEVSHGGVVRSFQFIFSQLLIESEASVKSSFLLLKNLSHTHSLTHNMTCFLHLDNIQSTLTKEEFFHLSMMKLLPFNDCIYYCCCYRLEIQFALELGRQSVITQRTKNQFDGWEPLVSYSKGHGFKFQRHILDGHFFIFLFVVKFVMFVCKDNKDK